MAHLRIVLLVVLTAVGYGVIHDQVTIRVSPEYLTLAHPRLTTSDSPTAIAAARGVAATWWAALPVGFLVTGAALSGKRAPLEPAILRRGIGTLVVAMATAALLFGSAGGWLTARGAVRPPLPWDETLEPARQPAFVAALWPHRAAYGAGAVGGLGLTLWVYRRRGGRRPFHAR